jgi:hypothetical protein
MPELDQALLAATVLATLEDAAFLLAEVTEDAPPFDGQVLEARLAWGGEEPLELRIAAPPALAAELAANLLGDDGADAAQAADAMGELVNMAAGALAAALHGPRGAPRLGLPRVAATSAIARAREPAAALSIALREEGGRRVEVSVVRPGRPA